MPDHLRLSVTGEPRGPLCGMGICFECRATIDGKPHVRTCQMGGGSPSCPVNKQAGAFDVLIIGAGPAGIAAACAASESGRSVGVVDDNPAAGGQIWRGGSSEWIDRFQRGSAGFFRRTTIIAQPEPGMLLAQSSDSSIELRYRKLILATGARERFLPFPGWTLPNVMGAGGLQAMVKAGLAIAGKRVMVAGTGPLLLAVAAYLRNEGADVALIAEQADSGALARFAVAAHQKLLEAMKLKRGIRYLTDCWPVSAEGTDKVEAVVLRRGRREWREPCDYLACGFGLVPNLELPALLGCSAKTDESQETSVEGIYCCGETTGVAGVELAVITGQIAGYASTGQTEKARMLFRARDKAMRFRDALHRAFALRDELKTLARPGTIVCRCEDVTLGRIQAHSSWRSAKLQTRCGMGACQGRVCGPALEFLLGWQPESVRPPLFPAAVEVLAGALSCRQGWRT